MLLCGLLLAACGGGGAGTSPTSLNSTVAISAPTVATATSSASKNTVTWQPVNGATSYNIYWSTSPNVTKNTGSKIINASSPYVHSGLIDTQKYYYVITSMKDNFESDISIELEMCASKVIAVDAGSNGVIALKSDGSVWMWNGLPKTDGTWNDIPKIVPGLSSIVGIATNNIGGNYGDNYLALESDGTIWAWGDNHYGQLGNGTTTSSVTPVRVNISDVVKINSIGHTSFAIKRDGTVWGWGYNGGALGYLAGATDYKTLPVQIPNLTGITDVSSNYAVKNNGTLWRWDENGGVMIPNVNNAQKLFTDSTSTPYWIATDGSVWSLVSGNPVQAERNGLPINNAISLSLYAFTVVKNDGTVWTTAWNSNLNIDQYVKVNSLGDAVITDSGVSTTFVIRQDGTLVGWGKINFGNNNTTYLNPVVISGL